jgi:hypothetical protein
VVEHLLSQKKKSKYKTTVFNYGKRKRGCYNADFWRCVARRTAWLEVVMLQLVLQGVGLEVPMTSLKITKLPT